MPKPDLPRPDQEPEKKLTLAHLEHSEWWHWAAALTVLLFVALGIVAMSVPTLKRDIAEQHQLDIAVRGLLGIVLIFDVHAIYQQLVITRLRRQLTKQVGMLATLECIKEPDASTLEGRGRKRQCPRYYFDRRTNVVIIVKDKPVVISGRTNDLSDRGLGVVLPESLEPGTEVKVQLIFDNDEATLLVPGVIRYRRGLHHGIEFQDLTPLQAQQIRKACAGATPVPDARQGSTSSLQPS